MRSSILDTVKFFGAQRALPNARGDDARDRDAHLLPEDHLANRANYDRAIEQKGSAVDGDAYGQIETHESHVLGSGGANAVVYEDKYVRMHSDRMVIKNYYIPFGSKTIMYKDIESTEVHRRNDHIPSVTYKAWGMGISPVWWARDLKRYLSDTPMVSVKQTDAAIQSGFSVQDIDSVMQIMDSWKRG